MRISLLLYVLYLLVPVSVQAQDVRYNDDDVVDLYAQTKQINQFLRRFNGEEDVKGNRYYPDDREYRNRDLREKYLNILFDLKNENIGQNDKALFKSAILNDQDPILLSLDDNNWWAEVQMNFTFNHRPCEGSMFLEIEEENDGLKWSIRSVNIPAIMAVNKLTPPDTSLEFIHPLSHELDFMNLDRVFQNPQYIDRFLVEDYHRDPLTSFSEYVKNGSLRFKSIRNVRFHLFQIENWYFEIKEFNRSGLNKGYLIANLQQMQESQKPEKIALLLNGKN